MTRTLKREVLFAGILFWILESGIWNLLDNEITRTVSIIKRRNRAIYSVLAELKDKKVSRSRK